VSFRWSVAAAAQSETAHSVSKTIGHREAPSLSNAVKHHWYGDTSPWTEQQLEDHTAFNGRHAPRPKPEASKVVILDRENPPLGSDSVPDRD
jgi:hypothetical protein